MFKNVNLTNLKKYLDTLIKSGFQNLLIQPYVSEFLKFYEIKTIWMNGKYQYAYGTKVLAYSEDAQEKDQEN